jgi:hypothetical protein
MVHIRVPSIHCLPSRSGGARVASAVLLVLATISFNLNVSKELPKLDYVTLIDWCVADRIYSCGCDDKNK